MPLFSRNLVTLIDPRNKIIFDGALPESKRTTRLYRLENVRRKNELFCAQNKSSLRAPGNSKRCNFTIDPQTVFQPRSLPKKYLYLPENPFMVPAVFEDLRCRWNRENIAKEANVALCPSFATMEDFPFAGITTMVPREADVDCALVSRATASAVLTNDSDLLLYDLGSHGSVLFLDSVEMSGWNHRNPAQAEIRALRLCPAALAHRLGILDIRRLAYELTRNPNVGLADLVRQSRDTCSAISDYSLFTEEYEPGLDPCIGERDSERQFPQCLDPRLSEIFCQYKHDGFLPSDGCLHMYLPILNDDYARRCAWEFGQCYRRLGYSVLNISHPIAERFTYIHEYVRRGQRIAVDRTLLEGEEQVTTGMQSLSECLSLAQAVIGDGPTSPGYWRIFAMSEIFCAGANSSKFPKPKQLIRFFEMGYMNKKPDWADVHLLAQIQAVLYSLRILKQFLEVTVQPGHFASSVKSMLASLPPLHVLMGPRHEIIQEFPEGASVSHFVDTLFRFCEQRYQAELCFDRDYVEQLCQDPSRGSVSYDSTTSSHDQDAGHSGGFDQRKGSNIYELLAPP